MLAHLTSASAQAAAASLVSGSHCTHVHTTQTHVSTNVHTTQAWHVSLSGYLTPAHSAPCSPPARRISAPSAMLTPFLPCSSPVATSPASKWAPLVQGAGEAAGIHRPSSSSRCRACINQHLMNNKDCFFCKATIVSVEDWEKAASTSTTSSAA